MLCLRETEPIAAGSQRLVFLHPDNPRLLVKVLRPEAVVKQVPWYKAKRRFGRYVGFVRECEEFIAGHAEKKRRLDFMQTVAGLVETDFGLGIVLEAALTPEGSLAPNVWRMIHRGLYDSKAKAALEEFFVILLRSNVVVADLHPGNLVYATREDGSRHFVMIDGQGQTALIPLKSWFPALNRRSKRARIRRLRKRMAERTPELEGKWISS